MSIRHTAAALIDAAIAMAGAQVRRLRTALAAGPRVRYALFDGYVGAYAEYYRHEHALRRADGAPPAGVAPARPGAAAGGRTLGGGALPQQPRAVGRTQLAA